MTYRSLYMGFFVTLVVCALLVKLAIRRSPGFPVDEPLVKKASPVLDEWPTSAAPKN